MLHPSEAAVDFIWGHFQAAHLSSKDDELRRRVVSVRTAMAHRPLLPGSRRFAQFACAQLDVIRKLEDEYPHLSLLDARRHFESASIDAMQLP